MITIGRTGEDEPPPLDCSAWLATNVGEGPAATSCPAPTDALLPLLGGLPCPEPWPLPLPPLLLLLPPEVVPPPDEEVSGSSEDVSEDEGFVLASAVGFGFFDDPDFSLAPVFSVVLGASVMAVPVLVVVEGLPVAVGAPSVYWMPLESSA